MRILTNDAILKLSRAGLGDEVIVAMVNRQPGRYAVDADSVIALKQSGVSDKVIAAMVNKVSAPSTPVRDLRAPDADGVYPQSACAKRPEPVYRADMSGLSRDTGLTGAYVMFSLVIGEDGNVRDAIIDKLTGQARHGEGTETVDLDPKTNDAISKIAIDTIKKWRFTQCLHNGVAVPVRLKMGTGISRL